MSTPLREPDASSAPTGTVVVGVDGSDESKRALRWAAEEARLRDAPLRVVYAYDYRPSQAAFAPTTGMSTGQIRERDEIFRGLAEQERGGAEDVVTRMIDELIDADGLDLETLVIQDRHPADALVEQATRDDILVVGSRGRGGITGLVLGSVSQRCLHHAKCPVVVIGPER